MLGYWEKLKRAPHQAVEKVPGPSTESKVQNITFSDGTTKEMQVNDTSIEEFWWKSKCANPKWASRKVCKYWTEKLAQQ